MEKPLLLIVDDEPASRYGIRKALAQFRFSVQEAGDGKEALDKIQQLLPDLVILDVNLPEMDGLSVLSQVHRENSVPLVIVITAYGSEKIAVEAMKRGAYDYVSKPYDIDELRLVVSRAMESLHLKQENLELRKELERRSGFGPILGQTVAMRKVFDMMEKVSLSDITVLIHGESGTGKELVAREIHRRSSRHNKPFITMNCAALPENLIESELFGHERGAFTGAVRQRKGKFELAHEGTIFLDEIGDMSLNTQSKILRILQERKFERLGGDETREADVRILSATHKDLMAEIQNGNFRSDLYYRLQVIDIEIPPLRERNEDIPLLVEHYLGVFSEKHNKKVEGMEPEAVRLMLRYHWPGNVRQLVNILERAVVLAAGPVLRKEDLPNELELPSGFTDSFLDDLMHLPFKQAKEKIVSSFMKEYLTRRLNDNDGNISHTAAELGIRRQSLQTMLRRLGIK
ncbi:sigma-54 dependent transcriptional regulator [bacterium]|nr:sigma-54 dependent transcriptional regulator [bacterium]MCI0603829.1 sigma-54 dependent transcriptional regulator [bacterium]